MKDVLVNVLQSMCFVEICLYLFFKLFIVYKLKHVHTLYV